MSCAFSGIGQDSKKISSRESQKNLDCLTALSPIVVIVIITSFLNCMLFLSLFLCVCFVLKSCFYVFKKKSLRSRVVSGLEAFSHNPADAGFAALAVQPTAMTKCLNQRFLSYWIELLLQHALVFSFHFSIFSTSK